MATSSIHFSSSTAVTFFSEKNERPYHDHCPLCIDSMVHPKDDDRKPAIIFLDMDGVMIGDRFRSDFNEKIRNTVDKLFPKVKEINDYHWAVAKGRHLHPLALKNMRQLTERIKQASKRVLVVLLSSWRNDATLQQHRGEVFVEHDFCEYLCGKAAPSKSDTSWTPECKQGFEFTKGSKESFGLDLEGKAEVAKFWMLDHGFDPDSTDFIIIDDDYMAGKGFEGHFIQTCDLFREEHLNRSIAALKV